MKLSKFRKEYSGSPWGLQEFAEMRKSKLDGDDAEDLREAAIAYLEALEAFQDAMDEEDILLG